MRLTATKIILSGGRGIRQIQENFSEQLNVIITDRGELLQAMSKEASKENAARLLAHHLGIHLHEAVSFGDDTNDIGISKLAGYSVAMGNAIDELKEICHEVTAANDEDGVAVVLETILGK